MPSVVNKCIVRDIKESLEKASSVTLAQFDKVSVKEMESFKKKLGSKGSWCQVMKNRLLKIALKEKGMDLPGEMCQLSSLAVMSEGEIVDYAKILVDFAKKNKSVKIKCGLMDEKLISSDDFVRISNLPSREVLLSTVFSALQGPILGFATVLSGVLRNFVGVVKAIEDKKREQGDAVEEKEEPKEAKQDGAAGEKDEKPEVRSVESSESEQKNVSGEVNPENKEAPAKEESPEETVDKKPGDQPAGNAVEDKKEEPKGEESGKNGTEQPSG